MKKILIHASLDFANKMIEAKDYIEDNYNKFMVILPELKRYQNIRDIDGDDKSFTKIKNRLTVDNIKNVEKCDVLLILNYSHRGIDNYVGGNSFIEMCIAFYLKKPIYLLNDIPENMPYTEEIKAFYPVVVYDFINLIKFIN